MAKKDKYLDMYKKLAEEMPGKELKVDKDMASELENEVERKDSSIYEPGDWMKKQTEKDFGMPYDEFIKLPIEKIDRMIEIKCGHTLGFSKPKNTLKNKIMIGICKYANKRFGKEWVYDAEKEPTPGYISSQEVEKRLRRLTRRWF